MSKRILALVAVAVVVGLVAPKALACWDNTDRIVISLKKLNLTTEQLKDVFVLQKEHKAVVDRAHREGLGCRYHENHDAVFEKQAIGVLTDKQFKALKGRDRTKIESLEFDNRQLRKENEKLQKRLAELEAALKRIQQAQSKQHPAKQK